MEIPSNYFSIIEEFMARVAKYGERGRVPASTLIKGGPYSGSYLLTREIYKKLSHSNDKQFNIRFMRLRLSDVSLSAEIAREMALLGPSKKPTIFFMDGIDRILNLPTKSIIRGSAKGRGAKAVEIVDESHKLRKILLENSNKMALISSTGLSASFMEDPDLPFYKFFNEIKVSPLTAPDSAKYFFTLLKKSTLFDQKSSFINELGEIAFDWPYKISGGHWLLIQKFYQNMNVNLKVAGSSTKEPRAKTILEDFFVQLQPILLMEIENYSREDRRFIEGAALLSMTFSLKEVPFEHGNATTVAKRLVERGILSSDEKIKGRYTFCHIALRTLLRYFSGANPIDVFSDGNIGVRTISLP